MYDLIRATGLTTIPPEWLLDFLYVCLTFLALLAAYRSRQHPNRFRVYTLWVYAVFLLLFLPAHQGSRVTIADVVFTATQSLLMLALAWPPGDLELFRRYVEQRHKEGP